MAGKLRKKGRKRRWIAVGILILAVIVFVAYQVLTSGGFLEPRIERALTQALEAECRVEGLDVGLFGGASVERFSLFIPPGEDGQSASEIVVENCFAAHDWTRLLTGDYRLESVRVGSFTGSITPSFIDWIEKLRAQPRRGKPKPVPQIEIEKGTVSIDLPSLRREVMIENATLLIGQESPGRLSGAAGFRLGNNLVRLRINAVPRQAQGELELAVQGFDLSALPLLPKSIGWFEPSRLFLEGSLTGNVSAYFPGGRGSTPAFSGEFSLAEAEAGYRGWPIELAEGFGSFRVSQRGISLRNLTANVGRGRIAITNGRIGLEGGKLNHLSLRGNGRRLDLGLLTHKTLPWSKYVRGKGAELESGVADVDFNLQWSPDASPAYEIQASLQDGVFRLPEYETRLTETRVDAAVSSSGRVSIDSARARVAEGLVDVAGSFALEQGRLDQPHLEVNLTDVNIDPDLVEKVDPKAGGLLKKLGLVNAETDGHVVLGPKELKAELDVSADAVSPEWLEYPLTDLSGTIAWTSSERKLAVRELKARKQGGQIEATGSVRLAERPEVSFSVFGRSMPLDEELLGLLPPDTLTRIEGWQPEGTFDVEVRCRDWVMPEKLSLDVLEEFQVEADLRNISLRSARLGQLVSNLYGHLSLQKDAVNLTGFTGEALGKGFRAGGLVALPGSDAPSSLQVESENVSISPEWLRNCPFELGDTLAEVELEGTCGVQAQLSQLPLSGNPLKGSVTAVFHYLSLEPREIPIRASGTARLNVQTLADRGARVAGEIQLQDAGAGSLDADRVSGEFEYGGGALRAPIVRIGAYGGKVLIENTKVQMETGEWSTGVAFSHMDFESLMGAFGIEGKETPSGVLRGTLNLRGEGANTETLKGGAEIKIDRGRLYGFPILLSVLKVLDLGLPSKSPVTNAYGVFTVGGGELKIDDLIFGGGGLPVLVRGTIGLERNLPFKNQPINLLVTLSKGKGILDSIPVINWIKHYTIDMLRSLVLQARVTGTFTDYEISTVADPVTGPVKSLWSLVEKVTPSPPTKED